MGGNCHSTLSTQIVDSEDSSRSTSPILPPRPSPTLSVPTGQPLKLACKNGDLEISGAFSYEEFEEWRLQFQEKNYQRMKLECQTDMRSFVLNNLLLSIPFIQNFQKTTQEADKLKSDIESQVNTELRKLDNDTEDDSYIQHRRGIQILSGIPLVLSQNYVYRRAKKTEQRGVRGDYTEKSKSWNFESILPVESYISLDNCLVHTEKELVDLLNGDYETIGQENSTTLTHLCMKECSTEAGVKIPSGYVQLYSLDPSVFQSFHGKDHPRPFYYHHDSIPSTISDVYSSVGHQSSIVENFTKYARSESMETINGPIPIPPRRFNRPRLNSVQTQSDFSSGYGSLSTVGTTSTGATDRQPRHPWDNRQLSQLWKFPSDSNSSKNPNPWKFQSLPSECFYQITCNEDDKRESEYLYKNPKYLVPSRILNYFQSESTFADNLLNTMERIERLYFSRNSLDIEIQKSQNTNTIQSTQSSSSLSASTAQARSFQKPNHISKSAHESDIKIPHTLTACVSSSSWPRRPFTKFVHRFNLPPTIFKPGDLTLQDKVKLGTAWPSKLQIQTIEAFGCNLVPLSPTPGNPSLEWQLNFFDAEELLLDSFKHPQWRCYIFSALLFRSFITPLNSNENANVDLSHIRNLLYNICAEDFVSWYDEEPGKHLKNLISQLYDCLGKRRMSNFFIPSQNLLRQIPQENLSQVQNSLRRIKENLEIYFIHSFKHLTCLTTTTSKRREGESSVGSNLKILYKLMTISDDAELLYIINPKLRPKSTKFSGQLKTKSGVKENRSSHDNLCIELLSVRSRPGEDAAAAAVDKKLEMMRRKFRKWEDQQKEIQKKEGQKLDAIKNDNRVRRGQRSFRVDLEMFPVSKWSPLRTCMIIQYFVEEFLKIGVDCFEQEAFAEATMYTMQIQNLCRLLKRFNRVHPGSTTGIEDSKIGKYSDEADTLLNEIGIRRTEYVKAKVCHLKPQTEYFHL